MRKRLLPAFLAVLAITFAVGVGTTIVSAEESSEVSVEYFGISGVNNYDTSTRDYVVFDVNFSRDAFTKANGNPIEYRIIDGETTAGEDYTYLQDYIEFNGRTMRAINADTDTSDYEFITFPSSVGAPYNVPVMIYVGSKSGMQVRVHKDWLDERGIFSSGLKMTFKAGLYVDGKKPNEELSAYVPVRYEIKSDITITKGGTEWTCDAEFEKYKATEELIERKDIDFSKIDYKAISVRELSEFVGYGDYTQIGDESVQNMFFQIYFDKPVFYQTVDYASVSKSKMKALCSNTMSEAQIDAWFDYRLDLSFADYLVINGMTFKELKQSTGTDVETKIFTQYSGDPYALTVYIESTEAFRINPAKDYTVTLKKGFRTPLFGEIKEDETFYYDGSTGKWSKNAPDGSIPDYGSETEVIVDYETKKGCSSSVEAIAFLPMLSVAAFTILKRRKIDE